jgi:hypothetical protein
MPSSELHGARDTSVRATSLNESLDGADAVSTIQCAQIQNGQDLGPTHLIGGGDVYSPYAEWINQPFVE